MIIPVFQPVGSSTHLLAQKVGAHYGVKATHTGTLDPMAEGVVVVLTDHDRFLKEQYADVQKTYEFQILVGFSTTSHDLLGHIDQLTQGPIDLELQTIQSHLAAIKDQPTQRIPGVSAKRINGESYFDLINRGEKAPEFHQNIKIYELEAKSIEKWSTKSIQNYISQKLAKITKKLNPDVINEEWRVILTKNDSDYFVITCSALTSKKTYIRAIIRDLSEKTAIPMTTLHINRVQNGNFGITDCICFI